MQISPNAKTFILKFATDFITTAAGLVVALNLAVPGDLSQAKAEGILVGSALASAAISAGRRAIAAYIAGRAGSTTETEPAVGNDL